MRHAAPPEATISVRKLWPWIAIRSSGSVARSQPRWFIFGSGSPSDAAPVIPRRRTRPGPRAAMQVCAGEIVASISMTEPGTGSDLKNIRTTAVRDGDHWVVKGQKVWITNGFNCGVVVVAYKTDPAAGAKGVSLIAVEAGTPGFTKGTRPMDKIGLKAQDTAELFFDDVRVPVTNLVGEEGRGFRYLMEQLPQERLVIAVRGCAVLETQLEHTGSLPRRVPAAARRLRLLERVRDRAGLGGCPGDADRGGTSEVLKHIIARGL